MTKRPAPCYAAGMDDWRLLVTQFLVASAAGCAAWLSYPETANPAEQSIAALAAGFGLAWLCGRVARALLRQ